MPFLKKLNECQRHFSQLFEKIHKANHRRRSTFHVRREIRSNVNELTWHHVLFWSTGDSSFSIRQDISRPHRIAWNFFPFRFSRLICRRSFQCSTGFWQHVYHSGMNLLLKNNDRILIKVMKVDNSRNQCFNRELIGLSPQKRSLNSAQDLVI